jgi:DNA repair protein RadC
VNTKNEEALALIQAIGACEVDLVDLTARLESLGGIRALTSAGLSALDTIFSVEEIKRLESLWAVADHLLTPPELSRVIEDAEAVAEFFRPRLARRPTESFWVLFLDARGHPLGYECVAEGTLTACLVHPREVFSAAIRARAAQLVLVHNHPSGDPSPSAADQRLTERMMEVGVLVGIPVVDHVVVALGGYQSVGCVNFMEGLA